jgi:hypothetical protein
MKAVGKKSTRKPLVPIRSEDELQKVLFIQRSCTRAAKNEILALAMDNREPEKFILAAKALLEKYAKYPTLTEFAENPKWANVYKWGATFGVAALIGSLIIEEVKALQPQFAPALRQMLLVILKGLDQPERESLPMEAEAKDAVELLVAMSAAYGLMVRVKDKVALTVTGKRVLMHLADAARFIEEMGKANKKFQSKKLKPV